MSRYRGPKLRVIRRLGSLPGLTVKKSKKNQRPGQHGKKKDQNATKLTEYGLRLEEKQKLKFNYGLTEKQLYNYVIEARRRKGITSLILLQLLEMRLDSVIFNLGFSQTMNQARQLVNHGHVTVNQKKVTIPSFECQIKDKIGFKFNSKPFIKTQINNNNVRETAQYVSFDIKNLEGKILNYCNVEDLVLELNELLIIEYYSRK